MNTLANQFKQQLKRNGKPCKVNNVDFTGFFKEINDDGEEYIDTKYFFTDKALKQGYIIEALGCKWLIIQEPVNINGVYSKYTVRKITHSIKFNFNGAVKTFDGCVDSKIFDIETGQYFSLVNGNIQIIIQSNSDANNIKLQQRFIKWGSAWELQGIDRTKEGLIFINAKTTATNQNDDLESEIPDRWQYQTKHNYSLIVEPTALIISQGNNQRIFVDVKDNDVKIDNPLLTYTSDNTSIAEVDGTGLVVGVAEGTCNVTISFIGEDNKTYSAIIPVTINKIVTHNYTLDITADMGFKIKKTNTHTFTAKKYDNDVEVPNVAFDFEIDYNGINTTDITITATTDTYIKIKNSVEGKSFILKATERGTTNCVQKTVELISIWG